MWPLVKRQTHVDICVISWKHDLLVGNLWIMPLYVTPSFQTSGSPRDDPEGFLEPYPYIYIYFFSFTYNYTPVYIFFGRICVYMYISFYLWGFTKKKNALSITSSGQIRFWEHASEASKCRAAQIGARASARHKVSIYIYIFIYATLFLHC